MLERPVPDLVDTQDGIERAALAFMGEFHPIDVIRSSTGLFGNGQDLTPVTGVFKDVNGDGKIDMIVQIQDQRLVYINDGTQFVPQQPGQQVHL